MWTLVFAARQNYWRVNTNTLIGAAILFLGHHYIYLGQPTTRRKHFILKPCTASYHKPCTCSTFLQLLLASLTLCRLLSMSCNVLITCTCMSWACYIFLISDIDVDNAINSISTFHYDWLKYFSKIQCYICTIEPTEMFLHLIAIIKLKMVNHTKMVFSFATWLLENLKYIQTRVPIQVKQCPNFSFVC